ncbi:hypothetical protein vseg_015956 [Gypsophila vaccaria]
MAGHTELNELPSIDLSSVMSIDSLPTDRKMITDQKIGALITKIGDACEQWGFFLVCNHGVGLEIVENLVRAGRDFFSLPADVKRRVSRDETNLLGYFDTEYTEAVLDCKEVFEFSVHEPTVMPGDPLGHKLFNRWPEHPSELRNAAEECTREVTKLGLKLLQLIALSLGVASNRLTDFCKEEPSFMVRLNSYMPSVTGEPVLGIGPHTDSEGITILAQDDVGGLQVKRKSDTEWISVKPESGSFIVNVGNILQVWSNDKYPSLEHRVMLNSNKHRMSIAFTFGPSYSVDVKPLDELIDEQNCAKYEAYNWGALRASRVKSFVKKYNIVDYDIAQFKITE